MGMLEAALLVEEQCRSLHATTGTLVCKLNSLSLLCTSAGRRCNSRRGWLAGSRKDLLLGFSKNRDYAFVPRWSRVWAKGQEVNNKQTWSWRAKGFPGSHAGKRGLTPAFLCLSMGRRARVWFFFFNKRQSWGFHVVEPSTCARIWTRS